MPTRILFSCLVAATLRRQQVRPSKNYCPSLRKIPKLCGNCVFLQKIRKNRVKIRWNYGILHSVYFPKYYGKLCNGGGARNKNTYKNIWKCDSLTKLVKMISFYNRFWYYHYIPLISYFYISILPFFRFTTFYKLLLNKKKVLMFIVNKPRIAFRSPRKSLIKIKVLDENIFGRNHILMPLLL